MRSKTLQKHQQAGAAKKTEEPLDFEEQMQEIAGNLMFPIATGSVLIFHFGLALLFFPLPKYTHFNSHLQGFLLLLLTYYLFERNGPLGSLKFFEGFESWGRRMVSWACIGSYAILWLMVLVDRTLIGERPGARIMGAIMGGILGIWLGLISSSSSYLLETMEKNKRTTGSANTSRPKNRKERRLAMRKAAATPATPSKKKRS